MDCFRPGLKLPGSHLQKILSLVHYFKREQKKEKREGGREGSKDEWAGQLFIFLGTFPASLPTSMRVMFTGPPLCRCALPTADTHSFLHDNSVCQGHSLSHLCGRTLSNSASPWVRLRVKYTDGTRYTAASKVGLRSERGPLCSENGRAHRKNTDLGARQS